jgi:hypothetical protein
MMKKLPTKKKKRWDDSLQYLLFTIREVLNESLGFSPFELLYGRQARGPLDLLREQWESEVNNEKKDVISFVLGMRDSLRRASEAARENEEKFRREKKSWYDGKARARSLSPGEEVLLLLPTSTTKLLAEWRGLYRVLEKCNDVNYKIQTESGDNIFHVNLLKKYIRKEKTQLLGSEEIQASSAPTMSEELSEQQHKQLHDLTQEFAKVFSDTGTNVGCRARHQGQLGQSCACQASSSASGVSSDTGGRDWPHAGV